MRSGKKTVVVQTVYYLNYSLSFINTYDFDAHQHSQYFTFCCFIVLTVILYEQQKRHYLNNWGEPERAPH